MSQTDKTTAIINRARQADFGQVFEQTIDNYKKIVVQASIAILLMLFVFFCVMVGISIIFMLSSNIVFTDPSSIEEAVASVPPYVNTIAAVFWAILLTPLTAGFLIMSHEAEKNRPVSFTLVFSYFRNSQLKHLLISAVIIALITEAVGETFTYFMSEPESLTPHPSLALILMVFNLFILVFTIFIIPLIVFEKLTALEAIKTSIAVSKKSFFTILLLLIVVVICAVLGIFAFCFGIIITLPLIFSCRYILYKNVVGIDYQEDVETIGLPESEI